MAIEARWTCAALFAVLAPLGACASSTAEVPDTGPDWDLDAGAGVFGPRTGDGGELVDGGTYASTECPGGSRLVPSYACDPLDSASCGEGAACRPYLDAPDGVCADGTVGTRCFRAGFTREGDACDHGVHCGVGQLCVLTVAGEHCELICDLRRGRCPDGRVCWPVDVPGPYGTCA